MIASAERGDEWSLDCTPRGVAATNIEVYRRQHPEIHIDIHGCRVGEQMAEMFAADRADSVPFSSEDCARGPQPGRS